MSALKAAYSAWVSPQKARNLLRRLPVRELADRLGVSPSTITRYRKKGKVPPERLAALESLTVRDVRATPRTPPKARNLLRGLPVRMLADRLGVSPSTITRYRKKGKVPPERLAALESLTVHDVRPDTRKVKKALKLSPQTLAAVGNVTVRTAKRWIKNRTIPNRSQSFLTELVPTPAPRRLTQTREESYKGNITRGRIYTVNVDALMSNELELTIASWVSTLRSSPNPSASYHMVAVGKVFIDPNTEIVGSAKVFFPDNQGHYGEVDMTFAGSNEANIRNALSSLLSDFDKNEHLTIFVKSITLYIRTPL